jgi:hypothetical protein
VLMHFFLVIGVSIKSGIQTSGVAESEILARHQQAYKDFLPSILHTFGKSKLTTYLVSLKHCTEP